MVFVALALFEYALLLFWMRKDRNEKEELKEKMDMKTEKWAEMVDDPNENERDEEEKDSKKKQKMNKKKLIRLADEISSIGFPVSFALFFIIYIAITAS